MASKRVAALGYYGMSNFGDDMFQEVVLARAGEWWPGASLTVVSPSVQGGLFLSERDSSLPRRALSRAYRQLNPAGAALRLVHQGASLAWADRVALCGGSVLSTLSGLQRIQAAVAATGTRAFEAVGVSVGPFSSGVHELEVKRFVSHFDRVIVRDSASMEHVANWPDAHKFRLGGDLAALWPGMRGAAEKHTPSTDGTFRIGLQPCNFTGGQEDEYVAGVRAALEQLGHLRAEVTVFALNNHPVIGDDKLAHNVACALRADGHQVRVVRYVDLGIGRTIGEVHAQDFNIATRLHGAIVSYLGGVPFASMNYHAKCGDFAKEIGLDEALQLPAATTVDQWRALGEVIGRRSEQEPWDFAPSDYIDRAAREYRTGPRFMPTGMAA